MSKRFKDKPCAYCPTGISDSGDHVFAREFFPVSERANLPQVPACTACNGAKSKLETYLTTVLLFGGRHSDAHQNLVTEGERRLAGNLALHRKLVAGTERAWLPDETGLIVPTMAIHIDDKIFTRYFEYVIRGLMRFEFGETLGGDDFVEIQTITAGAGEPIFRQHLAMGAAARANRNVGNGAFVYEGSKAKDNGHISVWLLSAFGGLMFQDGNGPSHETRIGAITGPRRVADRIALRQKWIEGRAAF